MKLHKVAIQYSVLCSCETSSVTVKEEFGFFEGDIKAMENTYLDKRERK